MKQMIIAFMALSFFACTQASRTPETGSTVDGASSPTNHTETTAPQLDLVASSVNLEGAFYAADGVFSDVTVTLIDANSQPIVGVTPTIAVSGTNVNVTQSCGATDASGISTCENAVQTTTPQALTVSITSPVSLTGNTVDAVTVYDKDARGYQKRHCGFDMDNDGIIGEATDDCNVCDGVTTDVDGDAADEDLFYVDSTQGNDSVACGTPSSPCQSLTYVVSNRLDGTSASEEDIICVSGTFSESIDLGATQGGKGSAPSTVDGIQYPTDPFMIVGWDRDNDGMYPPFDDDDIAVFSEGSSWFLDLDSGADNVELAHFTINDYTDDTAGGFVHGSNNGAEYVYVHDIESTGINKEGLHASDRTVFDAEAQAQYWTIRNVKFRDVGASFMYGFDASFDINFGFVIDKVDVSSFGLDGDALWGMIHFGATEDITIKNSVFDSNISSETYIPSDFQVLNFNQCMRTVLIENNSFLNVDYGVNIFIDDVVTCTSPERFSNTIVNRNYFTFSSEIPGRAYAALSIHDEKGELAYTVEGLTVTNNVIDAGSVVPEYMVFYNVSVSSGAVGQSFVFAGNTLNGTTNSDAFRANNQFANGHQDLKFYGNILNDNTGPHFGTSYELTSLELEYNIFNTGSTFNYNGSSQTTLAQFETAAGNINNFDCTPSFENVSISDFRLQSTDTCAKDTGTDLNFLSSSLSGDYAGTTRDTTNADIGAFQE